MTTDEARRKWLEAAVHEWRLRWNHLNESVMDQIEADLARHFAALLDSPLRELEGALGEITKGMGAFNHDPLIHASNTIDEMKGIARVALAALPWREEGKR